MKRSKIAAKRGPCAPVTGCRRAKRRNQAPARSATLTAQEAVELLKPIADAALLVSVRGWQMGPDHWPNSKILMDAGSAAMDVAVKTKDLLLKQVSGDDRSASVLSPRGPDSQGSDAESGATEGAALPFSRYPWPAQFDAVMRELFGSRKQGRAERGDNNEPRRLAE